MIAPSAPALLMMLFGHDQKELMKAFAVYGAAAPAGGTAQHPDRAPRSRGHAVPDAWHGRTVFGIVRPPEEGRGSAETLAVIAGGLVLLAAFVAIQAGRRDPLMRLAIFRTPNLAAANLVQLLLGAAWIPMLGVRLTMLVAGLVGSRWCPAPPWPATMAASTRVSSGSSSQWPCGGCGIGYAARGHFSGRSWVSTRPAES